MATVADRAAAHFKLVDKDNIGSVKARELPTLVRSLGLPVDNRCLQELVAAAKADSKIKKGACPAATFIEIAEAAAAACASSDAASRAAEEVRAMVASINLLFRREKDRTDSVAVRDLAVSMKNVADKLAEDEVEDFVRAIEERFDVGVDGWISAADVESLLRLSWDDSDEEGDDDADEDGGENGE